MLGHANSYIYCVVPVEPVANVAILSTLLVWVPPWAVTLALSGLTAGEPPRRPNLSPIRGGGRLSDLSSGLGVSCFVCRVLGTVRCVCKSPLYRRNKGSANVPMRSRDGVSFLLEIIRKSSFGHGPHVQPVVLGSEARKRLWKFRWLWRDGGRRMI